MIARSLRYGWPIGVMLAVLPACPQTANADLYQIYIRTIEWVTDNSDVIVAVSHESGHRKVQHVFKGNPDQISEKLVPVKSDFYEYLSPTAEGKYQLLFIRGQSELLQEIGLAACPDTC